MKWYAETTQWRDGTRNGIYLMNDSRSKVYAFRSPVTKDIKVFANPLRIDIRGRKFQINPVQYKHSLTTEPVEGRSWSVSGSKGNVYTVTENAGQWSCTCQGFVFRNRCKHIEELK
jgi:hypothetical protein